jgi:hypothetical protein
MSNLTFGPPVSLDGPLPVAPPSALLNVPGVLVGDESERWTNGVNVYPYPPGAPGAWDPCSSGTFRTKEEGDDWPLPMFASFVAYLPITCSAMSIGDPEEFANRAELALNAVESFSAEQQLSQGTGIATNPFFDDDDVDLLAGGAAVAPAVGLSYLEEAIAATGRAGMIHATPGVASQWFDQISEGGPLITNLGTRVAAGGGYMGGQPTGGVAAAAGQGWAYATGPVEVRRAPIQVLQISEVLDRSNNDVTFRAERYMLAEWDTVLQAAVLIDWSP